MVKICEARIAAKENEFLEKSIPCHGNVFNGWYPIRHGGR